MSTFRTTLYTAALVLLAGCDIVNEPIPPGGATGGGNTEGIVRRILLEDITGHRCNNCPRAARLAADLKAVYSDQLILVGVHAGGFAAPLPPLGDGFYDTDFRTSAGTAYNTAFQVMFYPAGMVNRRAYSDSPVLSENSWGTAVADMAGDTSPFELWFESITTGPNTVSTVIKLRFAEAVSGDHNLVVYLTEDHVVDWQLDSEATPPDVEQYEHRHVLRTTVTDMWGVPVVTGSVAAGDTLTLAYTDFAMDPAWVQANCALVAYVYNVATDEVMQAAEREFVP